MKQTTNTETILLAPGRKSILVFEHPDDDWAFQCAIKAADVCPALNDYATWLRGICKHGKPEEVNASECREKLFEFIRENDVGDIVS